MKLGPRLAAIAAMIPRGTKMADIGTDHAYLPVYLVLQGIAVSAVAGEVNEGPFRAAQAIINRLALHHRIDLRRGDGLSILRPGEVDVVVIAGMGGPAIKEILSAAPAVTRRLRRLVLQPMTESGVVRRWLLTHGFALVDEGLVEEDGKLYEIIAAEPGCDAAEDLADDIMLDIGPLLYRRRHPLLAKHIAAIAAHYRQVVAAMRHSAQAVQTDKYQAYCAKLTRLEDLLSCQ